MESSSIGIFDAGQFCASHSKDLRLSSNEALDHLFEIVPMAEELGYSRYWLGEHYEGGVAWRTSEILLAVLSGITERIRIGVAGIKLNLYSPLLVAQNFKLLEYLFSGRIDLGLAGGYAPAEILETLKIDSSKQPSFEEKVKDLLQYFDSNHLEKQIPPYHFDRPETWILGTGSYSWQLALKYKLNYCHSLFHKHSDFQNSKAIILKFKDEYHKHWNIEPSISIAVAGNCSTTEKKALKLNQAWENDFFVSSITGNPSMCAEQLEELRYKYNVSEIVFTSLSYTKEDKIECYSLLSEKLTLKGSQLKIEKKHDNNRA